MNLLRKIMVVSGCAIALAVLGAVAGTADTPRATSMTISMHALNGSGENGTATLTAVGQKVSVTVSLTGEPKSASEPAHVHFGRCPNIKAIPAYNVGPIVDGNSTSVVELTWAEITSGKYVVNVHESAAQLGKYVSCGNIGESATPLPLPTQDSGY
jgi:Cu/Zn superoxide dismutase